MSCALANGTWKLPHALGLDAAIVAALWQLAVGIRMGGQIMILPAACLFCGVWSLYLFDRVWDVRLESAGEAAPQGFARRFPLAAVCLATGSGVLAFLILLQMPQPGLILALGGLVVAYYVVLAGMPGFRDAAIRAPIIGFLFAGGVVLVPFAVKGAGVDSSTASKALFLFIPLGSIFSSNVFICHQAGGSRVFPRIYPEAFALLGAGIGIISGYPEFALTGFLMAVLAHRTPYRASDAALADLLLIPGPAIVLLLQMFA